MNDSKQQKMPCVLTHGQYEELVGYADGLPKWRIGGGPSKSLTRGYYLRVKPGSGYDRASSFFELTLEGKLALARYRDKYGIAA